MALEILAAGVAAFLDIFIGEEVRRARQRMADQRAETAEQAALTAEQQAEQERFAEAAEIYRQNLLDHHNRLRVFGKDHDDTLDDIFIDAYLLEKRTARERFDIRELHEQGVDLRVWSGRERERRNGMELVCSGENLYVLGKPGAGKTTFLKWATVQAAQGKLPRVPIFVSLHDYTNGDHSSNQGGGILPFITEQFADYGFDDPGVFIERLLRSGEAMVLFDGLDEVRREDDQRQRLTQQLRSFATRYRRCQTLITCRLAATEYDFVGFQTVEVADFTDEQVLAYAEKWFGQDAQVGEQKFKRFAAELTSEPNAAIKELCNSPLLLSMLCLDYDETMAFPTNRASLYRRALDVLLHRWDARRGIQRDELTYRDLEPERKVEMLSRIAYPAFCEGKQFFDQADLEAELVAYLAELPNAPHPRDINGTQVLKAVEAQHSILVERAQEIYSFSHLTFQEYFTARYIVDNREDGTLDFLISEGLLNDRWREVFLTVISALPRNTAERFLLNVRHIIDRLPLESNNVLGFIQWVNFKAREVDEADLKAAKVRSAYIYLTQPRSLSFGLARVLGHSYLKPLFIIYHLDNGHFDRAFMHASAQVQSVYENCGVEVAADYALFYAWETARVVGYNESLHEEISKSSQFFVAFEEYFEETVALCLMVLENSSAQDLMQMHVPSFDDEQFMWQSFAEALLSFMKTYRNIVCDWDFSQEEKSAINIYLRANELLVQCLNLAVVPNRREIEASLLLPPGAWSPPAK